MPPKVTDTNPSVDNQGAVEEATAASARRIVATYAQDFMDGVTLMCMLGVEPKGLLYKKVADALAEEEPAPEEKKTRKKSTKKASKKTTKSTKKTTKKSTKKTTKAAKKTTKAAKKTTAKKSTKKSTTASDS